MNRKRTSSFHLNELTKSPTNDKGLFSAITLSGKNKPKYHSAWNSIGKRDCTGIKPRRLDFRNTDPLTFPKDKEFKKLLKFGPKDLFKSKETSKRVKNFSPMEKEGKPVTPVKLKFGKGMLNFPSGKKRLGDLLPNNPKTVKKPRQPSVEQAEHVKTKSGKK